MKELNRPMMPESRSWQGREPAPPSNHQDLKAELDNINDGQIKCGPTKNIPKKKGQLGEGNHRAKLDQADNTQIKLGPLRKVPQEKGQLGKGKHAESGQVKYDPPKKVSRDSKRDHRADLDHAENSPEAERSQQRREPMPALHGRDNQSERRGSQEKRKPTPQPDQREKRAEPNHVEDTYIKYGPLRKERELSPLPVKMDDRAEINYTEDDCIKSGMPRKITKKKVDARDEHDYANNERGQQRKGPTSQLGHRQQGARVEEEHQTDIIKKGKSKEAEMSQQRLPANYARNDTMQGNMETIGDSSFDKLPLFYADAGLASNKTIAKPLAMKKPSNEGQNSEQEEPVSDSAKTMIQSKNSTQGHNLAVMDLVDETAQITKVAPLPVDAKYEIPEIPVGMKCQSDQQPVTPRKKRRF
ncbi:hypothetical protein EV363DRAFT_1394623 [Boletus edulis]|nr:hypothetical protein EV363DRAFT_1394623 [Boletus edulis]